MASVVALPKLPLEGDGVIRNLLHFLWAKDELDEGPRINIPDTVIYEFRQPAIWYFTSKNGQIKKKGKYNLSNIRIEEAFTRKAIGSDIIAYYLSTNVETGKTTIEYFDRATLRDFLYNREKVDNGILQKFVEPRGTKNDMIQGIWSPKILLLERRENKYKLIDQRYSLYEKAVTYEGPMHYSTAMPVRGSSLPLMVQDICEKVVDHVGEVSFRKCNISRMAINFKVDANDRVWLLWCSSLRLEQTIPIEIPGAQPSTESSVDFRGSASYLMPPKRHTFPSKKGPVSLQTQCEIPDKVWRAFFTTRESRAGMAKFSAQELSIDSSHCCNHNEDVGIHGHVLAAAEAGVVPVSSSKCCSCRQSTLLNHFNRISYKTLVAHFEQLIAVLVEMNGDSDGIEWPPSPAILKALDYVGVGPLEALRSSILNAKDRSKISIPPEDIEIPPIIREKHPNLGVDDYRRCRRDPLFLYKTANVCDECFLQLTQIPTEDPPEINILRMKLSQFFSREEDVLWTAPRDERPQNPRLRRKNKLAQKEHVERNSRRRKRYHQRKLREQKLIQKSKTASNLLRYRGLNLEGPGLPARIDAASKSNPLLDSIEKQMQACDSQHDPSLEDFSLNDRENAFFKELLSDEPRMESLSHLVSSQAALLISTETAKESRKLARRREGRPRTVFKKVFSPRELEAIDWNSPYACSQVTVPPTAVQHRTKRAIQAANTVVTKASKEHKQFLRENIERVCQQLETPQLHCTVNLAAVAAEAEEHVSNGKNLAKIWDDREVLLQDSSKTTLRRSSIHVSGKRFLAAVKLRGREIHVEIFDPSSNRHAETIKLNVAEAMSSCPPDCEELASHILENIEADDLKF